MSNEKWWSDVLNSDYNMTQSILRTLQWDLGVKMITFDFDLTLVDINTGGKWKDSVEKLAKHFRPCFREIIGAALKQGTLFISVVTFSIQPGLIAKLFKYLFPNYDTNRIIIEANPTHIRPQLSFEVMRVGKQNHLDKVIRRIELEYGFRLQPKQIFLFDDRRLYVKIARNAGMYAYLVNDDVTLFSIHDYLYHLTNNKHPEENFRGVDSYNSNFVNLPQQNYPIGGVNSNVINLPRQTYLVGGTNSNVINFPQQNYAIGGTNSNFINVPQQSYPVASLINNPFDLQMVPAWNDNLQARYGVKMAHSVIQINSNK